MLPVYCAHFGLTREPFNVTPDPSFLYLSASHREALAQLVYGIRTRRGFVVLTGEVGTGKTTLVQSLLEEIKDDHTQYAFLFDPTGSPNDLLRSLCQEFGLLAPPEKQKDNQEYLALLNRFLLESYQKGDNVAVIIDEAQNLSAEVLERVRLLSNFETKQDKLLQILLVGQPELSDRLNQPELRQLKQRVALRHHLAPLNLSECREYIAKRLEISGATGSLFADGAIQSVHHYSSGIPRLVNILCDNGLLSAYASRKPAVAPAMIEEIAQDLHLAVERRSALAAEESIVLKPREPSPRFVKERVFELAEIAERQDRVNSAPLGAKATLRAETTADKAKTARQVPPLSKPPDNGSKDKVEPFSPLVPQRFFESMTRALTEAMGPMASFIVTDRITAMGESKSAFPLARLGQLIEDASGEVANETMRVHFRQLMFHELHTISASDNKSKDSRA